MALQVAQLGELGAELVRQMEVVLSSMRTPDDVVNMMDAMGCMGVHGQRPSWNNSFYKCFIIPFNIPFKILRLKEPQ